MLLRATLLAAGTLAAGLLSSRPAAAQSATFGLAFGSVAKVVQGADTLAQAWVGGLNTPQFSTIDLNGDGQLDLFAFDRESARCYTFLNVAATTGGGRRYTYAPDYASLFPSDLAYWALLRDFDCDGRPDLFTYATGGDIRVFRNVADASGRPSFVLANNQLSFPVGNGYTSNLNIGVYNLPAILDVNGDGKLDIATYDFVNATLMELYLNASPGACGGVSTFNRASTYWGQLQACYDCGSYQLLGAAACSTYRIDHSLGHNVLLLDLDGDGKLDMLDGRDNCPILMRLLNSGTTSADAVFAPAGVSSAFPSAAAPVNLPVFPAPYQLDADFDGVPDLLMAPNMVDNSADRVSLRQCVQLYHNAAASAAAVPSYTLTNSTFLQGDMLDVSEGAMAAFGDLDGDGLPDMLIGNQGDQVNGYYRASLYYYRNVGSAHRPVYRLVTDDYLGLGAAATAASTRTESLRPALVDLNRDGALDLVYSAYDGTTNRLYYILNTAGSGQAASFAASRASYFKPQGAAGTGVLPARQNDTPCFVDVDRDGYVDMLLGTNDVAESGYSLRYFRNQGVAAQGNLDNAFVLADNDYGQLRTVNVNNPGNRPVNMAPTVADLDGDGQLDLLTVDGSGTVALYSNFRGQSGAFLGRTDLFYNALTSQYTTSPLGQGYLLHMAVTAADLNQDGVPEVYVGTESGGLVSYLPRNRAVLATRAEAAAALGFSLYPNPAAQLTTAETAQPTRLTLFDLAGRRVLADATLARTHALDLRGLAPGLYLVQATAADGTAASQRLAVQ